MRDLLSWRIGSLVVVLGLMGFTALWHMGSELPDKGSSLHPLHCKVDSSPLDHQGSPEMKSILLKSSTSKTNIKKCQRLRIFLRERERKRGRQRKGLLPNIWMHVGTEHYTKTQERHESQYYHHSLLSGIVNSLNQVFFTV